MSLTNRLTSKVEGLIQAISRYPVTTLFLLAAVIVNMISINSESEDYINMVFTLCVGALLAAVAQHLYERFFNKFNERLLLMIGAIILTIGYYFVIHSSTVLNIENGTKTGVVMFALMMAFIWIPTIKSQTTFNESFMSAFKSFFITVLFSAVIAGGMSAIIVTTDNLLFSISYKAIPHTLNIIFVLFAPIFFLSFTPYYVGKKDLNKTEDELNEQQEEVKKAVSCPKLLSVLISYIIIPLTAVFTVILLLYIVLNIGGDFWTKNLLEPMLVSYSITVIIVYILASGLNNPFVNTFRKVFPKVLLPIVLLQTVASIIKIQEMGITHGRYYVIMFGVFAIITAVVFSFFPVKRNGLIVAVLLVFSAISVIPPVDAFTVSRINQTNLLQEVLVENGMLEGNIIIPNTNISIEEKKTITRTVQYLRSTNQIEEIEWLPNSLAQYRDFEATFGFNETYDYTSEPSDYFYATLNWEQQPTVNINDYDQMIRLYLNSRDTANDVSFEINNSQYFIKQRQLEGNIILTFVNSKNDEVIEFNTREIVDKIMERSSASEVVKGGMLSVKDATMDFENEQIKVTVLVLSLDSYNNEYNVEMYMFVQMK